MNAIVERAQEAQPELRPESELDRLLQQSYSPRYMLEGDNMDKMMRLAEQLACSKLSVPDHLRGNVGDCLAIVTQAMLWNMNPFAVAQKTHLVNGKLGYEAQLVNAVVQNSGAVRGAPRYEYRGETATLECRVGYVLRGESEITFGEWLHIGLVTTKNSPLWKTNPKQQMGYLQVKNWARAFCPGAILGVYTVDELEADGAPAETPEPLPRAVQRKSEKAAAEPAPFKVDPATGEIQPPAAAPTPSPTPAPAPAPKTAAAPPATSARGVISTGQVAYLRNKLKAAGMAEKDAATRYGVEAIEQLNVDAFDELKSELLAAS